jgi:hypothetical protein
MTISTRPLGTGNISGTVAAPEPAPAEAPAATATVDGVLEAAASAGLDPQRLKKLLGPENLAELQSTLDRQSHTDQGTLKVMLDASRVPAAANWRDVLGDIKHLPQRDQGHALGMLARRLEHLPGTVEKTEMMDKIVDALHELRGQAAVDAMFGLAYGSGAACRADPAFEQFIATRE